MADKLVSIRMPNPLITELKSLVKKNHYLDLSEELRSIIRQRARTYLNPREQPKQNAKLRKQELLRELKSLLEVDE